MLLGLLERLQGILVNYNLQLTEEQIKNLSEILEWYKNGLLPSAVVKRKLNISYKETHELMIYLMTKDMLKPKYKIYCENDMNNGVGKVYDDPAQIPISVCDRCDRKCSLIQNLVVEFEVCI